MGGLLTRKITVVLVLLQGVGLTVLARATSRLKESRAYHEGKLIQTQILKRRFLQSPPTELTPKPRETSARSCND